MQGIEVLAEVSKAFGHPARIRILDLLAGQTECRGQEVFSELDLAQSTVSEHLRILREAGLVDSHRVGASTVYCLNRTAVTRFVDALSVYAGESANGTVCAGSVEEGGI